jgi:exodeoxyribonuclease-5
LDVDLSQPYIDLSPGIIPASLREAIDAEEPIVAPAAEQPTFTFSAQQQTALELLDEWTQGQQQESKLGGYAGTGKTTLIKEYSSRLSKLGIEHEIASFTGKAVSVLRKKGLWQARTLHDLLYKFEYDPYRKKYVTIPRPSLYGVKVVIVDEASMVSRALYEDLKAHGVKMLFVGDPAQLEPIGDNPNLVHEEDCDFVLTEIHRQANQSPILRLAQAVRNGLYTIPLGSWEREQSSLHVVRNTGEIEDLYDVIICGKNVTRHRLNANRRKVRGYGDDALVEGESVICLKNTKDFGVYNGMTFKVKKVWRSAFFGGVGTIKADLVDDLGEEYCDIPIQSEFFGKDYKRDNDRNRNAIPFDYGYALTAHKAQGSEWDNVAVVDEPLYGSDSCRWRYTSITRCAKNLTYFI